MNFFEILFNRAKKSSQPVHTVSFDWFLSDLEWILNLLTKIFDILPEIIMEYQI